MVVEKWDIIKIAEEGQSTAIFPSPSKHVCNASVYCLVWKLYLNIEIGPIFHWTVHYRLHEGSLLGWKGRGEIWR